MTFKSYLVPLAALALAGCGGGGIPVQSAGTVATPPPATGSRPRRVRNAAPPAPPPPVQRQVIAGVEGVIGATQADLLRQFGAARLDVWEGDARKLQFAGDACILDVYLYPAAQGREPQASYVDARQSSGAEVDRAGCIAALRKR